MPDWDAAGATSPRPRTRGLVPAGALQIQVDLDLRERRQAEHHHRLEVAVVPAHAQRHDPAVELAVQQIPVLAQRRVLEGSLCRHYYR